MLSEEQQERFIEYWEKNRDWQKSTGSKIMRGLPMAALFGLPILIFIAIIYFFLPDWYAKISDTSRETFVVIVVAVLIFIIFFAFLRMHFKWEMNEQLYLELKSRRKKADAANQSPAHS